MQISLPSKLVEKRFNICNASEKFQQWPLARETLF
jgi:hypothetical protein